MDIKKSAADAIVQAALNQGRLIEVGWLGLCAIAIPDNAPEVQKTEMRKAFFAGAQHVFASIMGALDQGDEPTASDMRRMTLIAEELETFASEFKREHNLP